jgi:hypothetical protein
MTRDGSPISVTLTVVASACCGPATAAVTHDGSPVVVVLATTAFACYGPVTVVVTRDSLPVAVALAAIRSTLAKRRPVVAGAPDLSAFAGARAGTIGVTLSTRKQKSKRQPLEIKGVRGEMLLTSSWRKPASSSLRAGGTSIAPAGASAAPAGASSDGPMEGASAPATGTNSTAASSARGDRGGGFYLSGVARPPSLSPPHPTTSPPAPAEGRVPAAHAVGTPRCIVPGAPAA